MIASRVSALTGAAACGNDSVVLSILCPPASRPQRTDGVHVDAAEPTSGRTPLHFAILNDRASTIDLLLELGASLTPADGSGRTAAHLCVVPRQPER